GKFQRKYVDMVWFWACPRTRSGAEGRNSPNRYRTLLVRMPIAVVLVDRPGNIHSGRHDRFDIRLDVASKLFQRFPLHRIFDRDYHATVLYIERHDLKPARDTFTHAFDCLHVDREFTQLHERNTEFLRQRLHDTLAADKAGGD